MFVNRPTETAHRVRPTRPSWRVAGFGMVGLLVAVGLGGCQSVDGVSSVKLTKNVSQAPTRQSAERQNIASLTAAIRANPDDPTAYNMRGTAYAQAKRYKKALADFNAALSLNPNYHQVYANRALVLVRLGRLQEALADYNRALEISPEYETAYIGRGKLYKKTKQFALALADFSRAIELDPNNAIAYFNRGLVYQILNQHQNAIADFDTAISLRPASAPPYFARGQSRMALGQYEGAYDDFYVAARRVKGYYQAWTLRGLAAERFGDRKKAARAYRRALQIKPGYRPAREGLERVARGQV